jgi:uncharacterized membrane protein
MRKILLINRILFLLSFLLPFILFECSDFGFGPSKKEREVAMTKAKQDSINAAVEVQIQADSILAVAKQKSIQDSINTHKMNAEPIFLKTIEENKKTESIDQGVTKKKKDKLIEKIWGRMLSPTNNSLSGLGITVFKITFINLKSIKINDLLDFLIPFNLLNALILLLLIIFKKIKLSRIFSIISLLFFIVSVFLYQETGILWGFWVAFILNMIDLLLVNLILYKPKVE